MNRTSSPAVAALLSFLIPGLGQAYAGRPRRALLWALPMLVLLAAAVLLLVLGNLSSIFTSLLRQEVQVALLIGNMGFLLYRLAAIVDAYTVARPAGAPRSLLNAGAGALVVLLLATTAMHGVAEWYGYSASINTATIFHTEDDPADWAIPEPGWESPSPDAPSASPAPTDTGVSPPPPTATPTTSPTATPFDGPEWAEDGRLNIVLFGSDEGPGRFSLRPDAIFLLSVDVETARAAIFGFWRYMSRVPLPPESAEFYPDGRFPGHINAIYRESQDRPQRFPGNDARGLRATAGAVQELAGVRVDHYVMVNLNGFVDVVEAMGGLWVDIPARVRDERYALETGGRKIQVTFRPGCQLLDGRHALAYARTRHQDGDWTRMGRQQHVLAAMRRQFDPLAVLPELPQLFDAAGENLYWTLEPDDLLPIARLAARVDADRIQRVVFVPPDYPARLNDARIEKIRDKVRGIFDEPEPPPPSPDPSAESCPPA